MTAPLVGGVASPPSAAEPVYVVDPTTGAATRPGQTSSDTPLGYQQVVGPASATSLPNIPAGATYALITPDTQGIRWRDDGTDPTATVGMPVPAGTTLKYNGNLAAFRFIQTAATSTVNISYYK